MEIAMKLLEKDTHEKQDTLVALRQQLEDVKAINLQMFHKVQVGAGSVSPPQPGLLPLPAAWSCPALPLRPLASVLQRERIGTSVRSQCPRPCSMSRYLFYLSLPANP